MDGANPRLFPTWKELVKQGLTWEYGSVHTHGELAEILAVPSQSSTYYSLVQRANEALERAGMALHSVPKVGYVVVNPDDYTDVSFAQVEKSRRHLDHAVILAECAPERVMDPKRRGYHERYRVSLAAKHALFSSAFRSAEAVIRPFSRIQLSERRPALKVPEEMNQNEEIEPAH